MNRIETTLNELYIKGGKSGSETITLTCSDDITVTIEEYNKEILEGTVDYEVSGDNTTSVIITYSYSDLYINGETYSGRIIATTTEDKLEIPVIINCSDTLIYSDVPNTEIIDVLDGINITYSSLPPVNKVELVLEDETVIDFTNHLNNGTIHETYQSLLNWNGVVDYDYIIASNDMSQIAHKMKKVTYGFDIISDKVIYIDYKEQDVIVKIKSTRNGELFHDFKNVYWDSDKMSWDWELHEDGEIDFILHVRANRGYSRVLTFTIEHSELREDGILNTLTFTIIQGEGYNKFMVTSDNPLNIDENEHEIEFDILSDASGEYLSPIWNNDSSNGITYISTTDLGEGKYRIKIKVDANTGYKRTLSAMLYQSETYYYTTLKINQNGKEWSDSSGGFDNEDETVTKIGNVAFWGFKEYGVEGEFVQKYETYIRTIDEDGNEEITVLGAKRLEDSHPFWEGCYAYGKCEDSITEAFGYVSRASLKGGQLLDFNIVPLTDAIGQKMFYYSNLIELNDFDFSNIVDAREMFACSDIKTVNGDIDMNKVSYANHMIYASAMTTMSLINTGNILDARSMLSGDYLTSFSIGNNLNLISSENINYLFYHCTNLKTIGTLTLSANCLSAYNAFYDCSSLTNIDGIVGITCDLDLSSCTLLTHDSLMNVINSIPYVYNSPTLTLSEESLSKLTDSELLIAICKGWNIGNSHKNEYSLIMNFTYERDTEGNRYAFNILGGILPENLLILDKDKFNTVNFYSTELVDDNGVNYYSIFIDSDESLDVYLYSNIGLPAIVSNATIAANPSLNGLNFISCHSIRKIYSLNPTILEGDYVFYDCKNLTDLNKGAYPVWMGLNYSGRGSFTNIFKGCTNLTNFSGISDLDVDLNLSYCTNLTRTSLISIFNNLKTVLTETYLYLGEENHDKLTDDDKKIATDKGWTLDSVPPSTSFLLFETENNKNSGITVGYTKFCNIEDEDVTASDLYLFYEDEDETLFYAGEVEIDDSILGFNTVILDISQLPYTNLKMYVNIEYKTLVNDLSYLFRQITGVKKIISIESEYVTNMVGIFSHNKGINEIELIDTTNVTNMDYAFSGTTKVTTLGGFKNLKVSLDLSECTLLTYESLMNVINNLANVTDYPILTLGEDNLSKLTDDEIAVAVSKGWKVA